MLVLTDLCDMHCQPIRKHTQTHIYQILYHMFLLDPYSDILQSMVSKSTFKLGVSRFVIHYRYFQGSQHKHAGLISMKMSYFQAYDGYLFLLSNKYFFSKFLSLTQIFNKKHFLYFTCSYISKHSEFFKQLMLI